MPRSLRPIDDGLIYHVSNRLPILGEAAIGPNGVDFKDLLPDCGCCSRPATHLTARPNH
jgi:hypothetical protein